MKKFSVSFKQVLFPMSVVALLFSSALISCNDAKPEVTKKVAEEHNEAKFNTLANEKDAQFLVNAAELNSDEMTLSKFAQLRTKNKEVKALAAALEAEHVKMNMSLSLLASKKQITIPTTETAKTMADSAALGKKTSAAFDDEYCEMLVARHKAAIATFELASENGTDMDIKNFAANSLTMLRTHLDKALVCQKACTKMEKSTGISDKQIIGFCYDGVLSI